MKAYYAFLKKELCEMSRTYKLFIMGIVFFIFGVISPLSAKYMPQIIEAFMPAGMQITLMEPTAIDSWAEFYKNISQMGLIVMLIVLSGTMANEITRGSLILVLTKGLSRKCVVMAKFTAGGLVWSAAYWLAFGITYMYTDYFWNTGLPQVLFSSFCLWLFGVMLIAVEILGGVIFSSNYGALLFTGSIVVVLFILNIPPRWQEYNPLNLAAGNVNLIAEKSPASDFTVPIILAVAVSIISILEAVISFNKKKI